MQALMSDEETLVQRIGRRAPRPRGRAFLTVLSGREVGAVHRLGPGDSVIGRGVEADVQIIDNGVSRKHAKVVRDADGTTKIVDLGSTNGTYVNGRRIEAEALREGDRIRIGQSATLDFRYEYGDDDSADVAVRRGREASGGFANLSATLDSLGRIYKSRNQFDAAIKAYERTLQIREDSFGPGHPAVAAILDNLGSLLRATGAYEQALARHRRAIEIYESRMGTGPEPPELAHLLTNLGETLLAKGDTAEALKTLERALIMLEGRRAEDTELAPVRFAIARTLAQAGREPLRAKSLAQLAFDGYLQATDGENKAAEIESWINQRD
jgi:pSer/pThr/pTyr-binding forkhead associated (FHA) protein